MPATTASAVAPSGVDVSDLDLPGLDGLVRGGDGSVPSMQLLALLDSIVEADLDTDGEVLDLAVAWERIGSWAKARHLRAVAEFVRRPIMFPSPDPVAAKASRHRLGDVARDFGGGDELGAALGLTPRGGEALVSMAVALAYRLPGTLAALGSGRIDYPRVMAMVDETSGSSREHSGRIETRVLAKGRRGSPGEFRRAVRRAVIRVDLAGAADRAQAARQRTWVRTRPADTDTAWLDAHLPAEDAAAIRSALDAAAVAMARHPDEIRDKDQLRAAALAAPFWTALATGLLQTPDGPLSLACAHGQPAAVQLYLDPDSDGAEPADLDGYGPITPRLGRELAARSVPGRRPVVRVVQPIGAVVARQIADAWPIEAGYRPSAALTRHVIARDRTCSFPGCSVHASRCDLDHTRHWPDGQTHPAGLGPGCRHHHRLKQHAAVGLRQSAPGHFTWTLPTGHTYQVGPAADDP